MKRHIALIGFMAAGKTTIGRKLARRLSCEFYDIDAVVVREHGPIAAIFATHGEPIFRDYERAAVEQALRERSPGVIALGGGALTVAENRDRVQGNAYSIFLKVSPERIFTRVQSGDRRRPLLGSEPTLDAIRSLYEARRAYYEGADYVVDADRLTDRAIVENILAWLHERQIAFPQ